MHGLIAVLPGLTVTSSNEVCSVIMCMFSVSWCPPPVTPDMKLTASAGSDRAWVWTVQADFADEEAKVEQLAIRFKNRESETPCSLFLKPCHLFPGIFFLFQMLRSSRKSLSDVSSEGRAKRQMLSLQT